MKRLVSGLIALVIVFVFSQSAVFANNAPLPLRVVVNKDWVAEFKVKLMMHNDVIYVPVDFFKDTLNVPVTQKDHDVELTVNNHKINFNVGEKYVYLDDVKTDIGTSTYLGAEGTIFIPLGVFCKLLGVEYQWDFLSNLGRNCNRVADIEVDHQISVWGDYLIFIDGDDNMTFISKTSGKLLASYKSTHSRDFIVYNDAIYSSTFGKGIEKVSLANDVVKKEYIKVEGIDTSSGDSLLDFNFSGDTIYYSGDADHYNHVSKIRSIKTDGSQSKVFLNAPKGYYIEDITIVGQTMYYIATKSEDMKIISRRQYQVNLSNPAKSVLISQNTVN